MNYSKVSIVSLFVFALLSFSIAQAAFDPSTLSPEMRKKYNDLGPSDQQAFAAAWADENTQLAQQKAARESEEATIRDINAQIKVAAKGVAGAQADLDAAVARDAADKAAGKGSTILGHTFSTDENSRAIAAAQAKLNDANTRQSDLQDKLDTENDRAAGLVTQTTNNQKKFDGKLGQVYKDSGAKDTAMQNYIDALALNQKFDKSKFSADRLQKALTRLQDNIDKQAIGVYTKEKMTKLLQSPAFCKASKGCGTANNGIGHGELDSLFPSGPITAKDFAPSSQQGGQK